MRPTHEKAVGSTLLVVTPTTATGDKGRPRWDWHIAQSTFDAEGTRVGKVAKAEVRTRAEALAVIRAQMESCAFAAIELTVEFTDTTGDYEKKKYNVDGTTDTLIERRADIPAARCSPLPTTRAETGQRRAAAVPAAPPGQTPRRGGAAPVHIPPAPVPGVTAKPPKPAKPVAEKPAKPAKPAAAPAELSPVIAAYLGSFQGGRAGALAFLVENPRNRGQIALWARREPNHPNAATTLALLDEVKAMATTPTNTPRPAPAPKPVEATLDPLVAPLVGLDVSEVIAHIEGMTGREKQALSGKIRARGVPADLVAKWDKAMTVINEKNAIPEVAARFIAQASVVRNDVPSLNQWLRGLPLGDRRGIGNAIKHPKIPEAMRALYSAVREYTPPVVPEARPERPARPARPAPAPAPTPAPAPAPTPAPARVSKMDQHIANYRAAVQEGTGATFLAGLAPNVRANLRKHLVGFGDHVLVASFDQDAPRRPESDVTPQPVAPEVLAHPVVVPPPPAPTPAPAPAAAAAPALDVSAILAQLQTGMGAITAAIDAKAESSAESLRTRRFR